MHIVLLGLMGVGKSTTAQAFAASQSLPCHDSDRDLQTTIGSTGAHIAESFGIDELHRLESAMLLGRLASDTPSVISAAAWVVEDAQCRAALARRSRVAVLHAPIDEIQKRMQTSGHRRSMARSELVSLSERRAPLFAMVSDLDLDAMQSTAALVAQLETLAP